MAENGSGLPLAFLTREFFAGLGFTQVQKDVAKRDHLLDLMVAGLNNVTPKTQEERETIRELTQRLAQLKSESVESLPEVKRYVPGHPDPEDDAQLMRQIHVSRERVMRALDAEKRLLANRGAR